MLRHCVSALALCTAGAAHAQDARALVVGTTTPSDTRVFADSYNVAQALRAAGFADVDLLRDAPAAAVTSAWERGPDLVYLTGPVPPTLRERLSVAGRPGIVLIDDCPDPLDATGPGLARASAAGCDAATLAARLLDAEPAALAELGPLLEGAWTAAPPAALALVPPPEAGPVATVADAVVSISPVAPAAPAASGIAGAAGLEAVGRTDEQIAIFVAPPAEDQAARATAAGLPEPSIIVGRIAPTPASFETVADEEEVSVAGGEVAFDTLEARRELRQSNPELFETLLDGGAFDPPDVDLVVALQTELQRMGCYRSAIDGDWGPGSRRSVAEYYAQVEGQAAEGDAPTVDLYRQLLRVDDVDCPAPVVQAPTRTTTASSGGGGSRATSTRATTTRTTTTRTTQPARTTTTRTTTTRTQAPAASSGGSTRRTIGSGSLSGVFR